MESITLEQVYYIGELISAFVVIISVVYLALQVRQNTKAIRLGNVHSISSNLNPLMDLISSSTEVADIYWRGSADFHSLNEIEQIRFRTLVMHFLRAFCEVNEQMREGAIHKETWEAWSSIIDELFQYPGFRTVWSMRKHWYQKSFQDYVDGSIITAESET